MISSFLRLSSPPVCPTKSYKALNVGSFGGAAAGAGGGGGGGGIRVDAVEEFLACPAPFPFVSLSEATGCGCGTTLSSCLGGCAYPPPGKGCAAGGGFRPAACCESLPPWLFFSSLPVPMGFAATGFPFGVLADALPGASPGPVWISPLLYTSSLRTWGSLTTLIVDGFPGFLLYWIVSPICKGTFGATFESHRKNSVLKMQFTRGSGC